MAKFMFLALLIVPTSLFAQSYEPREIAGWTVAPSNDDRGSCFMYMGYEGDGSTELYLSIDPEGTPYLMIRNDNWSSKEKEKYDLDFILSIGSYKNHATVGTSNRGFLTSFEKAFPENFAKSKFMNIEKDGETVDRLKLTGSAAGVTELRRCVAQIKRASDAITRERRRLQDIPLDPFAKRPQ